MMEIAFALTCLLFMVLFLLERNKSKKVEDKNEKLADLMARLTDLKALHDPEHYERVAAFAVEIGRRMGKKQEELEVIRHAALCYDVGMLTVPEHVLYKTESLDPSDFDCIKTHPVAGYHMVRKLYDQEALGFAAKYHHERYDGTGYPDGLARKNIPEIARIIAVADACDSMCCERNHRKALSKDEVCRQLKEGKGGQFDPEIAEIMLNIITEDNGFELYHGGRKTAEILLIDDDQLALNVGEAIIGSIPGCRVLTAKSYARAEAILEKNKIDLIFLDLVMPDTDGFDSYEKIRSRWDIPVVFMTSEKSLDIIKKASSLGAADYLVKPSSHVILKETVRSILDIR